MRQRLEQHPDAFSKSWRRRMRVADIALALGAHFGIDRDDERFDSGIAGAADDILVEAPIMPGIELVRKRSWPQGAASQILDRGAAGATT